MHVALVAGGVGEAARRQRRQRGDVLLHVPDGVVARRLYARPGERVGERALAGVEPVERGRQAYVGGDALLLRGRAVDAVEAGGGDLHGAELLVAHRHDGLDGALAVGGGVAHHDRAPQVAQRARHDLGGGRREAVYQHHHRLAAGELRLVGERREDVEVARLAYLHHGDRLGAEELGEQDRLAERPAAVAAEVQDESVHLRARLLELADVLVDVARAAAVGGVGRPLVHGAVELAELDVAESVRDAAQDYALDAPGGGLVLELYLVADEGDAAARGAGGVGRR